MSAQLAYTRQHNNINIACTHLHACTCIISLREEARGDGWGQYILICCEVFKYLSGCDHGEREA